MIEENRLSVKKVIGSSFVAIVILVVCQMIAVFFATAFTLIKVPDGVCNIIAGVLYLGSSYWALNLFIRKVLKRDKSEYGMPKLDIKLSWLLVALLLPLFVQGAYLLFFKGQYVSSNMSRKDIFTSLSAGIMFTGIAAGFVEEMVFRGVIMNLLKEKWNTTIAVVIPSLLFGFVHIIGMDFSFGSCLLILASGTMVGIMFSLIALQSSVWNSGLVHALWNIFICGGVLSIGDEAVDSSIISYVLESKAFFVTGGEFGIESSLVALLGYILVAGLAFALMKKNKGKGTI